MKKKILISIFSMIICLCSITVLAATESCVVNVDIPNFQGTYLSEAVFKTYTTNQKYWNNKTMSNHDGTVHAIDVKVMNSAGEETEWHSDLGSNSSTIFSESEAKDLGNQKLKIRNSTWSIYSYFSSGIWYYSV